MLALGDLELHFSTIFYGTNRRLGGAQPGNLFVSFVRAYARSGCLVELDQKLCGPGFSLFPFALARSWGFSFVVPGGLGELSLFPFGPGSFPLSLPPTPQTSYPTLVGLIGIFAN